MTTATVEHAPEVEHEAEGRDHPSDWFYIRIFLALVILTALEVSTYYIDFGPLFLPMLLIVMTIKFAMVILYFMHLKFDDKLLSRLFYAGLFLAIAVYVATLSTFHFWVK
jgi:cytochrome c oxidase subunit 4